MRKTIIAAAFLASVSSLSFAQSSTGNATTSGTVASSNQESMSGTDGKAANKEVMPQPKAKAKSKSHAAKSTHSGANASGSSSNGTMDSSQGANTSANETSSNGAGDTGATSSTKR